MILVADLRIVTGHWFVRWEYGKAGFPPDPLGLSTAQRTHLAEVCVDYLATGADISLLADLRLPDGEAAFNDRELRHMVDVQFVFGRLMLAGVVAAELLPFAVTNWGSGGSAGGDLALAFQGGGWGLGISGGYRAASEYEPYVGETFAYRPGNQLRFRLAKGVFNIILREHG